MEEEVSDAIKKENDHEESDPPAGMFFSSIRPADIFINMTQGGYEVIDTPHAQEAYSRHKRCRKKLHVKNFYLFHSAINERRLRILANSGYHEELLKFLDACSDIKAIINSCDNKKRTALHFAASKGSDQNVHLLLQHGANPNLQDFNGNTPLHLAACTHHIRVITLLLHFGADVKATDSYGKTPLHISLARLKMIQARDFRKIQETESEYTASKLKAEVGEIVSMLKEYFEKSGQREEHTKMVELNKKLWEVNTNDEVNEIGSLLSNFTQMTIDAAAKSKMSEE